LSESIRSLISTAFVGEHLGLGVLSRSGVDEGLSLTPKRLPPEVVLVCQLAAELRQGLGLIALRLRSREHKELEIVVPRHELAVLRRQISRPRVDERDRVFLAAAGQLLGRGSRSFFVSSRYPAGLASSACAKTVDVCGTATGSTRGLGRDPCAGAAART
jgi:hypothetical protein